jgi:uncharacterized protein (DUF2147 family)
MLVAHVNSALVALFFVASSALLPVWAQSTPVGLWRSIDDTTGQPKAEIRIRANSAGALVGVVEKAIAPSDEPLCTQCTDDRKDKPKVGMEIIRGAVKAQDAAVWEGGNILDPDNGRIYKLRLTPIDGGNKLEVRGAFGPFWRTQTWIRVN